MNKLFKKIARKVRPLARRRMSLMLMGLILVGVLIPETAFAADTETKELTEILNQLLQYINVGFRLLHALFWPILLMIGSLMDNDLIFGPGIGERLREIWVVMRNLVNIVFVFLLLIVALYNVSGMGGEGNLALKTILPKLVMAIIAVNFSFLGCKVILDAANVVNIAVYDLAGSVDYDEQQIEKDMVRSLCTNPAYLSEGCYVDPDASAAEQAEQSASCTDVPYGWDYEQANVVAKMVCCNELNFESSDSNSETCNEGLAAFTENNEGGITDIERDEDDDPTEPKTLWPALNDFGKNFFLKLDQNNIGVVMAVNLGQLNKLTEVVEGGGVTLTDLTINVLFSIVMYLVFGFAYVALFIVLLARLVVLWMVIALSPLIVLLWAVPQLKEYTSELDLVNRFVQHLLAPIIIGLSMSIGYLMVDKMNNIQAGGVESGFMQVNLGSELTGADASGKFLAPNISDLQQLMIAVLAVAVVWLGVFGAAEKTIASSITGKIKDFGQNAAKFTASLPKYIPFVPMPTEGGEGKQPVGLADMSGILKRIQGLPQEYSRERVRDVTHGWGPTDYSKDFERAKALVDRGETGEGVKAMIGGGIDNNYDYEKFREILGEQGVEGAPPKVGEFGAWYAGGGRGKIEDKLEMPMPAEFTPPSGTAEITGGSQPPAEGEAGGGDTQNIYNNITNESTTEQVMGETEGKASNLDDTQVEQLRSNTDKLVTQGRQERVRDILRDNTDPETGQLTVNVVADMEAEANPGPTGAPPPTA